MPSLLVIRSFTDVLRAQIRFVKCVGDEAACRTPTHFINLLWVQSTPVTDLKTNDNDHNVLLQPIVM